MIERIIGYSLREEFPLEVHKIKLLVALSLFFLVLLGIVAPVFFVNEEFLAGFIFLVAGISYLIPIWLIRIKDFQNAISVFLPLFIVTQVLRVVFGLGYTPRTIIWFVMPVIFGFVFKGRQGGLLSLAFTVLILLAFAGLYEMGVAFPESEFLKGNEEALFSTNLIMLLGLLSLVFYYMENNLGDHLQFETNHNNRLIKAEKINESGSFWINLKSNKVEFSKGFLHLLNPALNYESSKGDLNVLLDLIHPSDKEMVLEGFENVFRNKTHNDLNFRIKTENGEYKFFNLKGEFDYNKTEFIGVMSDISEVRKAIKNFEDYKNALDQSALVSITNRSGKIIFANKKFCEISKYEEGELLGKDHNIVNSGHHDPAFFRDMWSTIAKGKIWRGNVKNEAKDKTNYWVDTTIIPFMNHKNHPDYYMSIRFDVTERMNSINEIKQKNQELEQFSYVLSHDLKSPLRAIKTLIHFIKEDMEDADLKLPEEVEKNFNLIDGRVVRMEHLIMSVLSYAQVGGSQEMEWVNMIGVVEEVKNFIEIPSNFKLKVSKDLPMLKGNKVEIMQVVQNLITNAIKYNDKEEPELFIYPGLRSKNFLIHFKDNGKGIDPMFHDKVFNLFETLKQKESFESTGIGLPIVKKVVEKIGGNIYVKSTPGDGADFILSFPLSVCKID